MASFRTPKPFFVVVLSFCAALADAEPLRADPPTRAEPSLKLAARYLEEHSQGWLSWKTAQKPNGTICISCHTTVPFLLAYPVLRHELPTENSQPRFVESVRKRVEQWNGLRPWHTGAPHRALGSEVVLNTLVLALDDAAQGRRAPSEGTRKAIANLWSAQIKEGPHQGAWEWYENALAPWENRSNYLGATLAALALAHAPGYLANVSAEERPSLQKLQTYLQEKFSGQRLHDQLHAVWVASRFPDLLSAEEQQSVVKRALALQNENGSWAAGALGNWKRRDGSENPREGDPYGTAVVVATLKHLAKADQATALERGVTWLRQRQQGDGSWAARSLNTDYPADSRPAAFMSEAATAWSVLALWH